MIETVFSTHPSPSWPQEMQRLAQFPRRDPFEADAVALVGTLSQRILRSPLARQVPELAALAHWFRPANLREMAAQVNGAGREVQAPGARVARSEASKVAERPSGRTRVRPRGVVFALAPANVEVLFIYCWLLSLLAGNATVIRVSRKPSPVRDSFVALIRELAQEPAHATVLRDSWIVTYEHDVALSKTFSEACHARLVWGGDATIAAIRAIPLNPLAVEISFADRFSFAALDAASVLAQTDAALREVARRFVNDTLWSDQQACSSPRAVIWIGAADEVSRAQRRFWDAYRAAAEGFADNPSSVMARVTDLFVLAAAGDIDGLASSPAQRPALGTGTALMKAVREVHSGHGLFVEYVATKAADIADFVREKDQTLVVYGLPDEQLHELIETLPNRALDRIVAPGHATEFSTIWDGTDLFDVLTRKISLSA
jgi:Acyl-CoA reductase (LuxC)